MKNVKNMIAILTLVSILGISNSFAAESNESNRTTEQQYAQTAGSWLNGIYDFLAGFLTIEATEKKAAQPKNEKLAVNHNETLLRDEN